jgi:hypothetical protein
MTEREKRLEGVLLNTEVLLTDIQDVLRYKGVERSGEMIAALKKINSLLDYLTAVSLYG